MMLNATTIQQQKNWFRQNLFLFCLLLVNIVFRNKTLLNAINRLTNECVISFSFFISHPNSFFLSYIAILISFLPYFVILILLLYNKQCLFIVELSQLLNWQTVWNRFHDCCRKRKPLYWHPSKTESQIDVTNRLHSNYELYVSLSTVFNKCKFWKQVFFQWNKNGKPRSNCGQRILQKWLKTMKKKMWDFMEKEKKISVSEKFERMHRINSSISWFILSFYSKRNN